MIYHTTENPFSNYVTHSHHDIMVPCTANFIIFDEEVDSAFKSIFKDGYSAFNRLKDEDIIFADTITYVIDHDANIRFVPLIVPQGTEYYLSDKMKPTNFMVNQLDDYFGHRMIRCGVEIPYFHIDYSWEGIIVPQLQKYNNNMNSEIYLFDRISTEDRGTISRENYENELECISIVPLIDEKLQEEMNKPNSFKSIDYEEEEDEIELDF